MHKHTNVHIRKNAYSNMIRLWLNTVIFVYKDCYNCLFSWNQNFFLTLYVWIFFSLGNISLKSYVQSKSIFESTLFAFVTRLLISRSHLNHWRLLRICTYLERRDRKEENFTMHNHGVSIFFQLFARRTVVCYWNVITK